MDAQLHDFIRNPSWELGLPLVDIYEEQIGSVTVMMTRAAQNSFTLDRLVEALEPIAEAQPRPKPPVRLPEPPKEKTEKTGRWTFKLPDTEELPEDLQKLRASCVNWLTEQQSIRGMYKAMREQPDTDERAEQLYIKADRMRDLEDLLQAAYEKLDYYTRWAKYLPGTEPMEGEERIKYLVKRLQTNHDYLRKHRHSEKDVHRQQVPIREAEINELMDWVNG